MLTSQSKPRAIIFGLGAYYKKFREALYHNFSIIQLVDSKAAEDLELPPEDQKLFFQIREHTSFKFSLQGADCAFLLTPPISHAQQVLYCAKSKISVFVEKPVCSSIFEIDLLRKAVNEYPGIYCSDFYPDIRAIPLLVWLKHKVFNLQDSDIISISGDAFLWTDGQSKLGRIEKIEGKLLETSGFERREWLWDPKQGGVLLDLMYHFINLTIVILGKSLVPKEVHLLAMNRNRGVSQLTSIFDTAETYAKVEGFTDNNVPFSFEVAKYWNQETTRTFTIFFTHGKAIMHFYQENVLKIQVGDHVCEARLVENYYNLMARAFRNYVNSIPNGPFGLESAIESIKFISDTHKVVLRK